MSKNYEIQLVISRTYATVVVEVDDAQDEEAARERALAMDATDFDSVGVDESYEVIEVSPA